MTQAQIRRRKATIVKHQIKWLEAEYELQDICRHPTANKKYESNTGNYDPSADSYWIENRCPDCGKFWVTEQ